MIDLALLKVRAAKYGLYILVFLAYSYGVYFYGKAVQRAEWEKENVKALTEEVGRVKDEGLENASKGEKIAAKAATGEARLTRALGEFNEAIERARANRGTSCDLTDDELRALEAIYRSYGTYE